MPRTVCSARCCQYSPCGANPLTRCVLARGLSAPGFDEGWFSRLSVWKPEENGPVAPRGWSGVIVSFLQQNFFGDFRPEGQTLIEHRATLLRARKAVSRTLEDAHTARSIHFGPCGNAASASPSEPSRILRRHRPAFRVAEERRTRARTLSALSTY